MVKYCIYTKYYTVIFGGAYGNDYYDFVRIFSFYKYWFGIKYTTKDDEKKGLAYYILNKFRFINNSSASFKYILKTSFTDTY